MKKINQESELVGTGVCVVKFGATWCGPCKLIGPVLAKLESEFSAASFLEVDIDDARELGKLFNVRSVPTVVVLKNGQEFKRHVGVSLIDPLRKVLTEALLPNDNG